MTPDNTLRMPAEGFPPGEYIREFMDGRGWNQKEFAASLGYSESFVSDLLASKRGVSQRLAHTLATVFSTSAILWLNLEDQYQQWRLRSDDS